MLRALLIIVSFSALCHVGYSQSSDVVLWDGFSLEYEISDPLAVSLSNELRLNNNISQFKTAFTNLSFSYKISSPLKLDGGYRFSLTLKENRHRFYGGFNYRHKIKSIRSTLYGRLRLQHTVVGTERPRGPETYIRPKLGMKYNVKGLPLTVFTGIETWYSLIKPDYKFDRFRVQLGMSYEVTKRNTLSLTYQYQNEFNVKDPLYSHIIAFEVGVDITQKKDKKDKE